MPAMLLHCDYIDIHHKVLFPSFPSCDKSSRVAKCMNALNFDIVEGVVALHPNMHDFGNEWYC